MSSSVYVNLALALAALPMLVLAATVLHRRFNVAGTRLAAFGSWILLVGNLLTVFLVLHADSTRVYESIEAAETINTYLTISGIVSAVGLTLFAAGLLWFALQSSKHGPRVNAI